MTIDRVKQDLKDAVSEAEDYIDDLHSRVEDLEAENLSLANQLDDAQGECTVLADDLAACQRRLSANKAPGLRPSG